MNQQRHIYSLPSDQTIEAKGSQSPQNGFLDKSRYARIRSLLAEGKPDTVVLLSEMLTEWPRVQMELQRYTRELQTSGVRFRQIIEKNADGILIVNQDGIIRFVNPAAEALFGRQAEALVGEWFGFPVTAGETTEIDIVRRPPPPAGGPETMPSVPPVDRGGGGTAVAEMRVVEIEWEGEIGYLASLRDITERKRMESELENARQFERHLAYHDALTGLPNRLLFYDRLRQAMAQAKRHRQLAALLFLDLDGFKRINDTLGHSVGDLLLQSVAGRLCDCLRETDTVARLGGDEFTVILNDMTQAQGAATVAQKILNVLSNPYLLKGHELVITTSIGISLYPSDGTDVESLVRSADTAMYRAKEQGKNTYQWFASHAEYVKNNA